MHPLSLLLISSDGLGWASLRPLLGAKDEFQVIGEAYDPGQAVELASTLRPDIILTGLELCGASAVPLITRLGKISPKTRIAVSARRVNDEELLALTRAGVACCLEWNDLTPRVVYHCLAALGDANLIICSQAFGEAFLSAYCPSVHRAPPLASLAERELGALNLLASDMTLKEIAARLCISPKSVETHLIRAREKLGAHTNPYLVRRAIELGIITRAS